MITKVQEYLFIVRNKQKFKRKRVSNLTGSSAALTLIYILYIQKNDIEK